MKSIEFNFPVYVNNEEVSKVLWEKDSSFETLVQLSHKIPDSHIVVKVDFDKDNRVSKRIPC